MLDQFSATVEKIYAAAADATLWEDALRAIEGYTGSTGAVLNLVPKHDAAIPVCLSGSFSDEDCAEYSANYMWRCPRIAFAQKYPDVPIHWDRLILTEREMDRDATYEWYGSHGLRYYLAAWTGESSTHRAYMSLQRSRRQGHVEPDQVDQFALIAKHMTQALALAVKLGTLEQQHCFSIALIDSLPSAVFVLDAAGDVLITNAKADRMLKRGDGLVIFNRRLHCQIDSQQPLLDRLVSGALGSDPLQPWGGWARIERSSGHRPYAVFVSALNSSEELFGAQPKVLVIAADPVNSVVPNTQALHELYGLTETEARLASAIARGHSLESAAASLHMQVATARSHLKAIFAKLSVNRQQDLVRLLTSLSTMMG